MWQATYRDEHETDEMLLQMYNEHFLLLLGFVLGLVNSFQFLNGVRSLPCASVFVNQLDSFLAHHVEAALVMILIESAVVQIGHSNNSQNGPL